MGPARLGAAVLSVVLGGIVAGWIKLPLPYPAVKQYAQPVPTTVYPWTPSPIDKGLFKIKHKLQPTKLFQGQIHGSESVAVCPDGHLVMIDKYGAVRAAPKHPDSSTQLDPKPIAHLGPGRPLGFTFDAEGNLMVCDALKGLIMYNMTSKQVVLLTNKVSSSSPLQPGTPINYANDLDIASDGTVYFTDSVNISPHRNAQHVNNISHIVTIRSESGFYDTFKGWALGMLQGLPQGRLLAYYPQNRTTHVLATGLYYSNGVALSKDESYIALSETDQLRVLKYYLPPHPKAGTTDVLIDKLPGTPDGVSRAADGSFWVSLISDIPGFTKWFGLPIVRGILGHIPENWRPQLPTWGAVLKVSESGQLLQWLVDLKGETEERETLREQLCAVPAEADPTDIAINVAKLRDLEARLLQEREEKAVLAGEKGALMARLAKLKDAGTDELREKAELQEALVRSEEQRLEIARALIDFQMETNEAKQEWTNTKYALEQRIMELESGRLEHHVRVEDHAALADERDSLARRLREADDEAGRHRKLLEAEREQSAESLKEVRRLNKLLAALEAASAGDPSALLRDTEEGGDGFPSATATLAASRARSAAAPPPGAAQSANAAKVNLTEVRLQLQRQLKQQERRIAELESQLAESQQQLEAAQSNRTVTQEALDQARNLFKRKMEAAAQEVSELAQRVALANGEPGHMLAVGPDELLSKVTRYLEEVVQVCQESIAEARRDADGLSARHSQLRRRCRQLYNGYRSLRYKMEDEWPQGTGAAPPRVAHEDAVIGGSVDDILRADDEADRQALVRQQNKVAALEAQLASLKLEVDTLGPAGVGRLGKALGSKQADGLSGPAVAALQLENSRLREEVDALKRRLPALGLLRRTSSNVQLAGAATDQLVAEVAQLRADNERLRAAAAAGRCIKQLHADPGGSPGVPGAAVEATGAALHRQVKEFAASTQLDLQRQIKSWEARAVMAEEQMAHLQKYIATASVAYQREIVRLFTALQKLDPSVKPPVMPRAVS